jgi:formate hydrogenlyase subunit 4
LVVYKSFENFSGNFLRKIDFSILISVSVFIFLKECNTYYYTMSHQEEHPLVVALAWTLSGIMFSIYLLVKMGAAGSIAGNNHVSETLMLNDPYESILDDHSAD